MSYDKNIVFVIMPINKEVHNTYLSIKRSCARLGLYTLRADEINNSGSIIEETTEMIIRAEFIICDLSMERPNVYFELGFARGVGNSKLDIFLIAKEGTILHFDVGGYKVKYYSSNRHLSTILKTSFLAMVQERRKIV